MMGRPNAIASITLTGVLSTFVVFKKTVVSDHMVIDVSDNVSVVSDHMFSGCPCTMRRVTDSVCKDDEK